MKRASKKEKTIPKKVKTELAVVESAQLIPNIDERPEDALIVERSLLGALAALIPLPFVDDVLLKRARKALFLELARRARLYVDDEVIAILTAEPQRSMVGTVGVEAVSWLFRRATLPLTITARGRAALQTFQLATLFDQYARQHHSGLDLDVENAKKLRAAFDQVLAMLPPGLASLRRPATYGQRLREAFDARWMTG
jgi:hypothetical protein